jgi:hypothetical protein
MLIFCDIVTGKRSRKVAPPKEVKTFTEGMKVVKMNARQWEVKVFLLVFADSLLA